MSSRGGVSARGCAEMTGFFGAALSGGADVIDVDGELSGL
jgi:hypothetical protein